MSLLGFWQQSCKHLCLFRQVFISLALSQVLVTLFVSRLSSASEKKIGWAVRIFDNWQKAHNLRTKLEGRSDEIRGLLEDMEESVLCDTMCKFILEVRKVSGEPYPRETLYSLVIMMQMYLDTKGHHVRFLDPQSVSFVKVRNTLDNRMKCLSREGYIMPKSKAQVITYSQEENMWQQELLGDHTPERLLYTVLYLLGVQFALRTGEEHKSLKFGKQLVVQTDVESGDDYLEYTEYTAKNNQGGIDALKASGKVLHCYRNPNANRCLVTLYQKYIAARPVKNPKCSADFYLRPLAKFNSEGIGYSCQPLGIHKIESAIKNLYLEAGLKGKRSNHSLRATAATRLYEAEVDEQLIQEHTGHRSNAIRGYKRTSSNLQKKVCGTLYGAKPLVKGDNGLSNQKLPNSQQPTQVVDSLTQESQPVSNMPLHDSPEGQALHTKLTAANMTLRQAMNAPVSTIDSDLFSTLVNFVHVYARPQTEPNSNHSVNVHVHFHL